MVSQGEETYRCGGRHSDMRVYEAFHSYIAMKAVKYQSMSR